MQSIVISKPWLLASLEPNIAAFTVSQTLVIETIREAGKNRLATLLAALKIPEAESWALHIQNLLAGAMLNLTYLTNKKSEMALRQETIINLRLLLEKLVVN